MSPNPSVVSHAPATVAEPHSVPSIDPVASRRWLSCMPRHSPWLHEEIGARMADRLGWIQQPPKSWLDWNPALGGRKVSDLVAERYQQSARFWPSASEVKQHDALNSTKSFWKSIRKPLGLGRHDKVISAGHQVDMIWANMLLHAASQPRQLMRSWFDLLSVNGFLMFSGLGPDSLQEIRRVYQLLNLGEPAHAFTDMHDWGDMLVASGFADPVMDSERIVLTYSSAERVLEDLRSFGRNLSIGRRPTLCSRSWRERLLQGLEHHMPRSPDGRLTLTLEVVYGHAYKGAPRHSVSPETRMSVADMKDMLGSGRRLR